VSVQTDAQLGIDTQEAELQIAAHDPNVATDHEYLLERDTEGFAMEFGDWGEQNEFHSTKTMLIANAGTQPFVITGMRIEDDSENNIGDLITVRLHDGAEDEEERDTDQWTNSVTYWENGDAEPTDNVVLNTLTAEDEIDDDPYAGDGMTLWHEETGTDSVTGEANWVNSGGTDAESLWQYDSDTWTQSNFDFSADDSTLPNANACWVSIELNIEQGEDGSDYDGTIYFDIDYL